MIIDRIPAPVTLLAAVSLTLCAASARGQAIDPTLPVAQVAAGVNYIGLPDVAGTLMPVEAEFEWPIPIGTYLWAHLTTDLGAIAYNSHVVFGSGWDGSTHYVTGAFFIPDLVVSGPGTSAVVTVNMHHTESVDGPQLNPGGGYWTVSLKDLNNQPYGYSYAEFSIVDGIDETLTSQAMTVPVGTPFTMTFTVASAGLPGGAFGAGTHVYGHGTFTLGALSVLNLPDGYSVGSTSANIVDNQLLPSPQPWSDLGAGLAGTYGEPTLAAQGPLLAGTGLGLHLDNALESAPVVLVIGFSEINAPFKGGTMVPNPDLVLFGLASDIDGRLTLVGNWSADVPSGFALSFQEWIDDPAGVAGWAATNGLQAIVP